jgi:hypothetical protein
MDILAHLSREAFHGCGLAGHRFDVLESECAQALHPEMIQPLFEPIGNGPIQLSLDLPIRNASDDKGVGINMEIVNQFICFRITAELNEKRGACIYPTPF